MDRDKRLSITEAIFINPYIYIFDDDCLSAFIDTKQRKVNFR